MAYFVPNEAMIDKICGRLKRFWYNQKISVTEWTIPTA